MELHLLLAERLLLTLAVVAVERITLAPIQAVELVVQEEAGLVLMAFLHLQLALQELLLAAEEVAAADLLPVVLKLEVLAVQA
jgi:hypothetical protein